MSNVFAFEPWPKIPRHKSALTIMEKLDGSNAQVALFRIKNEVDLDAARADPFCLRIFEGASDGDSATALYAGSRTRWLDASSKGDNFGFAKWVLDNSDDLVKLGAGRHYGEWWGLGIQRGYGLNHRRFSLFNTARWSSDNPSKPDCCSVVPVICTSDDQDVDMAMEILAKNGSIAAPGFMKPEGIVIYHHASRQLRKRTFDGDPGKWATIVPSK